MQKSTRQLTISIVVFFGSINLATAKSWDGYADKAATFRFGFVAPAIRQYLNNPGNPQAKTLDYEPNIQTKFGLGVSYGKFGLSTSFAPAPTPDSEQKYGKTTASDYQLRFFGDVHTYDLFYQRYSGFYIGNSADVDPAYTNLPEKIQRPDIDIEHYGFQYFYNFHPDKFHPGYFDQSAIPTESGGALLAIAGVNHHRISADSALIPSTLSGTYGNFENFKAGEFLTAKIGGAGGYCLVFKSFYLAAMALLTGGQQKQKYDLGAEKIEKTIPQSSVGYKLSTGFNSRNFFMAINFISDSTNFTIDNANINATTNDASIWLGFRY